MEFSLSLPRLQADRCIGWPELDRRRQFNPVPSARFCLVEGSIRRREQVLHRQSTRGKIPTPAEIGASFLAITAALRV